MAANDHLTRSGISQSFIRRPYNNCTIIKASLANQSLKMCTTTDVFVFTFIINVLLQNHYNIEVHLLNSDLSINAER